MQVAAERSQVNAAINGLRFIAFFVVFIRHALPDHPVVGHFAIVQRGGYIGITLFFALSGFLIGRNLIELSEKGGASVAQKFRFFYARRVLRIFPLYYALLIVLLITGTYNVRDNLGWHALYLTNVRVFLFHDFDHDPIVFWTLCIEEHFYLLAPVVVFLVNRRWLQIGIGLFWILIAFMRVHHVTGGLYWFYLSFMHFDSISVGVAMAFVHSRGSFLGVRRDAWIKVGIVSALVYSVFLFELESAAVEMYPALRYVQPFLMQWSLAMASATLSMWLADLPTRHLAARIVGWRPIAYLGSVSYGLYLFHAFFINEVSSRFEEASTPRTASVSLALTFIVAIASWHLFEKPIHNLRNKIRLIPSSSELSPSRAASGDN